MIECVQTQHWAGLIFTLALAWGLVSASADAASPPKCISSDDESHCVTIRQQGIEGHWHKYELVNACKTHFTVYVFERRKASKAGALEEHPIGPCQTLSGRGNASWDRNAALRWEWQNK